MGLRAMSIVKSRLRFYLAVMALLMLSMAFFLGTMSSSNRAAFVSDYGNTLARMVSGDWEFSELTEPERKVDLSRIPRSYGRRSSRDVFFKLDRDEDGQLDQDEVGRRLAASLGEPQHEQFSVEIEAFVKRAISASMPNDNIFQPFAGDEKPPLTAGELFDSTKVMHVEVTMDPGDFKTLSSQRRSSQEAFEDPTAKPYTYFKGDISINGHAIKDVGIRTKGFLGSPDSVRPGLKIKFDEFVEQESPIEGLERLTLNNNKQDRALVSQFLTYKLFRDAGIMAPRVAFAAVTVNGKYLGVYSHVESIRKPFLQHSFGNDEGNLYEGTLTDYYPKSIEWFERKTNKDNDDRSQLLALSTLLDREDPTVPEISQHVELGYFFRYWAIESLIHFWDGYTQNQNNFYVYENPADNLTYFVPWGADSCFTEGGRWRREASSAVSVRATSILANRLFHIEGVPDEYRSAMLDVLGEAWDEQSLLAEIDRIEKLLHDYIDFSQAEALVAMDDIRDFIKGRRAKVMAELDDETWPVEIASGPRIPMHDEQAGDVVGAISGSISGRAPSDDQSFDDMPTEELLSEDGLPESDVSENEPKSDFEIDSRLSLNGQTESFTSGWIDGDEKIAAGESSQVSVTLSMEYEGEPLVLTLNTSEVLTELAPGEYEVSGELTDWSDVRRGRSIRGGLNIKNVDIDGDRIEAEFQAQFYEKRGGHMDRRR